MAAVFATARPMLSTPAHGARGLWLVIGQLMKSPVNSRYFGTKAWVSCNLRILYFIWRFRVNRQTGADFTLKGISVPKGTLVATSGYVCHRDPQVWPDPETFKPDRSAHRPHNSCLSNHMPPSVPFELQHTCLLHHMSPSKLLSFSCQKFSHG